MFREFQTGPFYNKFLCITAFLSQFFHAFCYQFQ